MKCSGVNKNEETKMFGKGTGKSDANLYPANWKQQSPAPEPHSQPYGQRRGQGNVGGRGGPGDGEMGRRLGSVSIAPLFLSLQMGQTLVCVDL